MDANNIHSASFIKSKNCKIDYRPVTVLCFRSCVLIDKHLSKCYAIIGAEQEVNQPTFRFVENYHFYPSIFCHNSYCSCRLLLELNIDENNYGYLIHFVVDEYLVDKYLLNIFLYYLYISIDSSLIP